MKLFLTLIVGALLSVNAFAYSSAESGDVGQGFRDYETKTVVKSVTALYSDAITKGDVLFYSDASGELAGLYTVSKYFGGTPNAALATRTYEACVAKKDVATGDVGGFPCVVKGYVAEAAYDVVATATQIAVGDYLCISNAATAKGKLVACASGVTSKFIALEAKAATAQGFIKVKVDEK